MLESAVRLIDADRVFRFGQALFYEEQRHDAVINCTDDRMRDCGSFDFY